MKVRSDEPYDLVNAHILPKHNDESWKHSDFKALVGHLRYVKDKLKEYLESAQAHGKSVAQAYELLREGIWIGTKRLVNGSWRFNKVGELYLSKEYKPQFCMESYLPEALDAEKLVSPDYLAKKPKDPDIEAESWRQFFINLGVRLSPALEADGHDWKCSNEMQLLLDSQSSAVRRATLECMSIHWLHYAPYLTYTHHLGGSKFSTLYTKFALSLRTTQAPTKKRTSFPLAEAYYPTTELKMLLGDNLPYVDAVLSETMLNGCGVTHRLDAFTLVKRLKQLKAEGGGTPKQVQAIYRALDERLWNSDSAYIKQAFSSDRLIQINGTHKGWFKPSELVRSSNGTFLDSLYPPLPSAYRDFSRFFLDKLGVFRDLPAAKRVEALTRLGEIANHDDRMAEALAIYRHANRDLGPRSGQEVQAPAWLKTFQTEAVYINQRGEVVHNDEYLFVNDAPALGVLFEDDEDLSFLAIPSSEVPRLSRLLDATEVARLSDSITHEVGNADSGVIDEDLTVRVRRSVHFFARVLYAKRPEAFQLALDDGRLASLWELEVANVPQVNLLVSLGDYSRETTVEIALSEGRVLYRTGARLVKDMLAEELSKFLVTSADLADTFARILMESEVDTIEDFLGVKSIGVLPSDLLEALDRPIDPTADEAEIADAESALTEQLNRGCEVVPEEESVVAEGEPAVEAGAKLSNGGLTSSPAPALTSSVDSGKRGMEPGSKGAPSPSTGIHSTRSSSAAPLAPTNAPKHPPTTSPRAPAPQVNGNRSALSGVPPSPASPSPAGAQGHLATSGDSVSTHDGVGGSPSRTPSGRLAAGQADSVRRGQTTKGLSTGESQRGQPQPQRTKAGRLLSYAAGPGEADQPNPEDALAKAAAREATGRAAVEYFMTTQAERWKSLTEMPHNNPGFDVQAIADDEQEEFIEVKGQSGAWTEEGVALTPMELMTAQQKGDRYWLCVVEYAQDDKRRQLHLLRDPFGLTQQFRFDVGWKSVAESVATVRLTPEKDMYIDMPGVGFGRILSVRGKGRFFNLHVFLDDGRQVNKPFNPAKMTLSKEPTWQG